MQQYLGRGKNVVIVQDTVQQSALPVIHALMNPNFVVAALEDPCYWKSNNKTVTGSMQQVKDSVTAQDSLLIDSLNSLLLNWPVDVVLSWVASLPCQTVIILHHADVLPAVESSFVLHELLHSISTVYMTVANTRLVLSNPPILPSQQDLICIAEHRKGKGKMQRDSWFCTLADGRVKTRVPLQDHLNKGKDGKKHIDPTKLTTFALGVTADQQKARAQVRLPFLEAQQGAWIPPPVSDDSESDFDEV